MNIALSGSTGFIGNNLKDSLKDNSNINLIEINRRPSEISNNNFSYEDFFSEKFNINIDIFIHLGGPNYDYANDDSIEIGIVGLTEKILLKLNSYNCKNFIYFSSCKIYGESSINEYIYNEKYSPKPISEYAHAKLKAEKVISSLSIKNEYNYLIYRLPFVFGPGMKSNLGSIMKVLDKSLPIMVPRSKTPLKKSFLSINNIIKVIKLNIQDHATINNQIFNLTDTSPISLNEFISIYKLKTNSKSLIINLPTFLFKFFLLIPFLNKFLIKVFGSFHVDNHKIIEMLDIDFKSTIDSIENLVKSNYKNE